MNIQPIEKRDHRADGTVIVHSIFKTIQGEGPFCGTPCVFVRLTGCNLQCPACDTDYSSRGMSMIPIAIAGCVREEWGDGAPGLVVITGGEPFRQNIHPLLDELVKWGFYVQIETNGTLDPGNWAYSTKVELGQAAGVYIVCSPKTPKIHPAIYDNACALKYVVRAGAVAADGLPQSALDMPNLPARPPADWNRPIYVQPLDSKDDVENTAHTSEAVASCLQHGYTLQLQVHKFVGVE